MNFSRDSWRAIALATVLVVAGPAMFATDAPVFDNEHNGIASAEDTVSGAGFNDTFDNENADSGMANSWEVAIDNVDTVNVSNVRAYSGSNSLHIVEAGAATDSTTFEPSEQPYSDTSFSKVDSAIYVESTAGSNDEIRNRLFDKSGNIALSYQVSNGNIEVKEDGTYETVSTGHSDEWVYLTTTFNGTGYTLEWDSASGSGSTSGTVAYDSGISRVNYRLGDSADVYLDDVSVSNEVRSPQVSGYVDMTDGRPAGNTTVQVTGVDFANLNGTAEQIEENATRLQQLANDPRPTGVKNQLERDKLFTGSLGSGRYVAVHSPRAWDIPDPTVVKAPIAGDTGYRLRDPQLELESDGGPYIRAPAGETLILSVWDGSDNSLLNRADPADSDLPGATDEGKIVIEQLGPGGGDNVLDRRTIETDNSIGGSLAAREHKFAKTTLSPGFYRVYPEGNSKNSYIVTAGDPAAIANGYASDLKTKAGSLTDRAQTLRNLQQNGTFDVIRVQTNSTGYYSADTSQTVNNTAIIAYKAPAGVSQDPSNITRADVREYYESQDLKSALTADSVYIATDAQTDVTPPADNVNVTVKELSAPSFLDLNRSANRTEAIKEYIKDKFGWSGLNGLDTRLIENMPKSELEDHYGTQINLTEDSTEARERAEEIINDGGGGGGGGGSVDWDDGPDELSSEELKERVDALEQSLQEQKDVINSSSSVEEAANGTVNVAFEFARELASDDVAVYAEYANGTTQLVDSEHYTVEQGGLVGGGTQIQVTDYPVDDADPAAVTFRTEVLDNGDSGSERVTVRNPSFTGQIPGLQSVSFSSLAPGPDEQVSVAVDGESNYRQLEDVTVTDPAGQTVPATVSNGEASFQTSGKGVYTTAITYSNPDGENFTERVDVEAIGADIDQPATIRAQQGVGGPYALTGDDLQGGDLQTRLANGQITTLGRVGSNDDPPTTVHSHVETIDTPRKGSVTVRVTREPDDTTVRQRTTTVLHLKDLGDDYHVYRRVDGELQPIAQDGNQYGSISTQNGTTVSTYSASDGEVTVYYVTNPTITEDLQWRWENIEESLSSLPFTVTPAVGV